MFQTRTGGISSLTCLGRVDVHGNATQLGDTEWSTEDNGNPGNMTEFTRDFLGQDNIMFIIERNLNRNVCYYTLDLESSRVIPTWLIIPDGVDVSDMSIDDVEEVTEERLTMLENRVYGVDTIDDSHFVVRALKGAVFTIRRDGDSARATIEVDNRTWVLNRIMIHTTPSRLLGIPSVTEIHLDVEDENGKIVQFFFAT